MRRSLVSLVACLALGACASMAPAYERPASPVPAQLPAGGATATPASDIAWQAFVLDDRLRQVIALALANSRDLRKTLASVESARAQYRVQDAATLPTITANAGGTSQRALTTGNSTARSTSYSATVGTSAWEIDLFGRLRSLSDAQLETWLATAEGARAARLTLIGDTAGAWLTLAADRSALTLSRQTMDAAERSMSLTRKRLEAGVASRVDVRQAETVYQQARADVASNTTAIAQARNALELLVGHAVGDELLPASLPAIDGVVGDVQAGLSSSVLLQRPDVLQAEHQLKSANADIGAARAAYFPTLSLTGQGGVASAALSTLLSGGATIWSLAPALSLTLFDGGAHDASLAYAKSQRALYVSNYELTLQTAFKEVADALARRATMDEQVAAQAALVEAADDSYGLANARYAKGVDSFLSALDSQRTLYSAQQALVTTQLEAMKNRVTLYQVLGGGTAVKG